MKPISTKNLDQDETRTLVAQLGLHAANLRGLISARGVKSIQPPTLAADDDIAGIDFLVNHISELEQRLGGTAPAFTFSAARTVVSHKTGSAAGGLGTASSKKLSITERVLKARGVGSLEELRTSLSDMSHEEVTKSARKLKA